MKRFILFLLLSGLLVSGAVAQSTIFLVRHAEKADASVDPNLSVAGQKRARRLANVLKDAGISKIFVTELKRTKQTAKPLALLLSLTPQVVSSNNTTQLIAQLAASSGNILVVGHSNTIPQVISGLGITTPIQILEGDYDNLFVLLRKPPPRRLIRLHYF
jgi:broad specificity phosphatase PhoE